MMAKDADIPGIECKTPRDRSHQRRLTRAVGSDEHENFPGGYRQVDPRERLPPAKSSLRVLNLENGIVRCSHLRGSGARLGDRRAVFYRHGTVDTTERVGQLHQRLTCGRERRQGIHGGLDQAARF